MPNTHCITSSTTQFRTQSNQRRERLVCILGRRNPRPHREDVRLGSRLVLVVEAHRTVRAKVISVTRFGRITAFNAVHSAASDHLALTFENEIDFFFAIVERTLATAACIDCDLSETGNASQNSILRIAFPEDGFVAATSGFGSSNVLT